MLEHEPGNNYCQTGVGAILSWLPLERMSERRVTKQYYDGFLTSHMLSKY